MNTDTTKGRRDGLSSCSVATMLLFASLAFAKSYDIIVDTANVAVTPVVQTLPRVPDDADLKKGLEGWVQLQFDIAPDGRAENARVVDSVGGAVFEAAALDAVSTWSFEPVDDSIVGSRASIKFKNGSKKEKASRSFMRWYNMAARELMDKDLVAARENIERAKAQAAWNLYERSLLEVLDSEIYAAEGEHAMQLAALRRVIQIDNQNALSERAQLKLYKSIFELELTDEQFQSARETLSKLRDVKGSKKLIESLADEISQLDSALARS